jgi:hypothetical protein
MRGSFSAHALKDANGRRSCVTTTSAGNKVYSGGEGAQRGYRPRITGCRVKWTKAWKIIN